MSLDMKPRGGLMSDPIELHTTATQSAQGGLKVSRLTHRYGVALAVDDVNFSVPQGEIVALLGPSGCGKSTVLRAIAGLIQPKAGRISVGDNRSFRASGKVARDRHGFPELRPVPTSDRCREHRLSACLPPRAKRHRRERVAEMLALVRLEGIANTTAAGTFGWAAAARRRRTRSGGAPFPSPA